MIVEVLSIIVFAVAAILLQQGSEARRKQPGETEWAYFERVTGHRFHDGPQNGSWCTRCGTAAEYWREAHNLVGFIRSKCPGPYRTPRWIRIARWMVR